MPRHFSHADNYFPTGTEGLLFTVQGSNTIGAHLAPAWAHAWLQQKGATNVMTQPTSVQNEMFVTGNIQGKNVTIAIHAHGSSTGFIGLLNGSADIAMASRSIKEKEVIALKDYGDMRSFSAENIVAIDGLAVIVNPTNPVDQLPVETVAQIFSGEIKNWREVGGPDRAIRLYARDEQSGTWDTFKNLVFSKRYSLSANAKRFESNDMLSKNVANDPSGIGFVGLASVNTAKALAINDNNTRALKPDVIYVATEDYPLSRRLYLYSPEQIKNPLVDDFIAFAHSRSGQEIVESIGFVSQNPTPLKVEKLNGPDEYRQLTQYAERLSINFRFKENDAALDNKARQDITRITQYIKNNDPSNIKVQLVGFSDTENTNSRADILSRLRASAVKIALFRNGIASEPVLGYGSNVLVANSRGSSRDKNDRVEVWIFDNKPTSLTPRTGQNLVVNIGNL